MDPLCFIILRHINSDMTDVYWKQCYYQVRQYYKEPIYIIDDNSTFQSKDDIVLENATVINSEFPPQRGEVLPYYYFHRHKLADKAVILHDSIFLHAPIPGLENVQGYKPLFDFIHRWDQPVDQSKMISAFQNYRKILPFSTQLKSWKGMFGAMCVVDWQFLDNLEQKYKFLDVLIAKVMSRYNRMSVERIMGILFHSVKKQIQPSIYGDVGNYFGNIAFKQNMHQYLNKVDKLDIEKVWSGR